MVGGNKTSKLGQMASRNLNMTPIYPGSKKKVVKPEAKSQPEKEKPVHRSFRLTKQVKQPKVVDTSDDGGYIGVTTQEQMDEKLRAIPAGKHKIGKFSFGTVSTSEKILFIDNLSTMLKAGLALAPALQTLTGQVKNKYFKNILQFLYDHVENGQLLSEGMKEFSKVFNEMIISTVEVGENTGKLSETLYDLAKILKAQKALRGKVLGALMYPVIVLIALIGVSIFLAFFVFPQLIAIFIEAEVKLPFILLVVQATTEFVSQYLWFVILGILFIIFLIVVVFRMKGPKLWLHTVMLRIPFAGNLAKEISLTRFTSNLNTLLTAGLSIIKSLDIVSKTISNQRYRKSVREMARELEKGISLEKAMAARPELFPSLTTQLVHVGEKTGELDNILTRIAEYYEERVDSILSNLTVIIEPILLVLVGAAVAFIALSIIGPIYELTNSFGEY